MRGLSAEKGSLLTSSLVPPSDAAWRREDTLRLLGLCAIAFVMLVSYAIARPTIESLFLSAYKSRSLPHVWIAVLVVALLTVGLYNHFAAKMRLLHLYGVLCFGSAAIFGVLLFLYQSGFKPALFGLYVWKDTYIILVIELFWAYANTAFNFRKARWIYGLFCVMGSLGGLVTNLNVGKLAKIWGTLAVAWLIVPVMLLLALLAVFFQHFAGDTVSSEERLHNRLDWAEGFRVVKKSYYLWFVFFLILLVQLITNVVDYQYNVHLEKAYGQTAQRTAIIGQVYAWIDVLSLVFQLSAGILLRTLGVSVVMLALPAVMLCCLVGYLWSPSFWMIAWVKIIDKSLGYSLFRTTKELLYLPLSYDEKTQGKSVVDVLPYRGAKGMASLLLLAAIALHLQAWLGWILLSWVGLWFLCALVIVRRYRALDSQADA